MHLFPDPPTATGAQAVARLVDLAAGLVDAPMTYVWLREGALDLGGPALGARPGPRLRSYAERVALTGRPVVVHDGYATAPSDGPPAWVVAFAGAPLVREGEPALGTLCAVDRRPRLWTTEEVETLETIARAIATELLAGGALR